MTHRDRAERVHQLMHGYRCPEETRCIRMIEIEITAAVREYIGVDEEDGPGSIFGPDDPSRWGSD